MPQHLLAIDQGTTGSTVLVLGEGGEVLGRATREFPQHSPRPGWVEHEPGDLWTSVLAAIEEAVRASDVDAGDCAAIGLTNQRETALLWRRSDGRPVHRAIVWQDRRTSARCAELREAGHLPYVRERTGLVLDPYFSATKLEWMLRHVDGALDRAKAGELAFGTVDSYLVYRLTGGREHLTDATNASRTLLLDLRTQRWDPELCALFGIPEAVLPRVVGNAEVVGHTHGVPGLPDGIPIAGMAGDQHAALFGQTCFAPGDAKCTYGTGAFLLTNTGAEAVPSEHGLVTTVAWRIGSETTYALEGSAFIAGAAVQWLRDGLGLIERSEDVEALARQVDGVGEVVFVPALAGLGAPHWDPDARGLIAGLTRDTTAAHLARAALEGIAFQITDLLEAMEADAGQGTRRLRVDGGASRNDLLMQLQSDFAHVPIDRPAVVETTALGAAYLAGLGVGLFADRDEVAKAYRVERRFEPGMDDRERETHLHRWRGAVDRARSTRAWR
ncbi:MAG: glycerol kinase GlpK [Sandaracinaceae bacterium]